MRFAIINKVFPYVTPTSCSEASTCPIFVRSLSGSLFEHAAKVLGRTIIQDRSNLFDGSRCVHEHTLGPLDFQFMPIFVRCISCVFLKSLSEPGITDIHIRCQLFHINIVTHVLFDINPGLLYFPVYGTCPSSLFTTTKKHKGISLRLPVHLLRCSPWSFLFLFPFLSVIITIFVPH